MSIKQISVFLENKPGTLLAMTGALAEHGIDMRALSLSETSDFGIARLIVDDIITASTVLKDAGFTILETVSDLAFSPVSETSDRAFFICSK